MSARMTEITSRQRAPSITRTIGLWVARLFVVLWLMSVGTALVTAQEAPPPSVDQIDQPTETPSSESAEQEKKRRVTLAGILIVSLVSVVGLLLILVVIWWAQRLRRINDTTLPKQHPGDPLWYLRKGSADDSSTDKTDKGDETTHG